MTAETKRIILALLILATLFGVVGYLFSTWLATVNWNEASVSGQQPHDYWTDFWYAAQTYGPEFFLGKMSILGRGSFGSATFLQYVPWAYIGFLAIVLIRSLWSRHCGEPKEWYLWVNLRWIAFGLIFLFLATSFAAYAHYADLYTIRLPDGTHLEGSADTITHTFSPNIFTVILLAVNIMGLLGLHGFKGRIIEAGIVIAAANIFMLVWEIGESGNPGAYANPAWNSVSDLFHGNIGTFLCVGWYNLLVPFEDEPAN
jgi:hypothetical protein